jgi:hypothetical protein
MEKEFARLRDAQIVRRPDQTLVDIPRPVGEFVVRGRTKKETLRRVEKLSRRGYVLGASPIGQFHTRAGGGYGVKVALARPLPEPMPGWAKGLALVGASLSVLAFVGVLLINALAALVGAAAGIAWGAVAGAAFVAILAVAAVKRFVFGGGITINQSVNF